MKEHLYTLKCNLTKDDAIKKISKIMQNKINEALKVKYTDLAELLESDLKKYIEIINTLYSCATLKKVEKLYSAMDTAAREEFYTFCKIEAENHKPFFADCMSIDDVKLKLIKEKKLTFVEEFNGLNFTLMLKYGKHFYQELQLSLSDYTLQAVKNFCCEFLDSLSYYEERKDD